jgi:hypothetical protein
VIKCNWVINPCDAPTESQCHAQKGVRAWSSTCVPRVTAGGVSAQCQYPQAWLSSPASIKLGSCLSHLESCPGSPCAAHASA